VTFERAEELGLIRFYGDPAKVARLRGVIAVDGPDPRILDRSYKFPDTVRQGT
jgi:hypothetical protein